MRRRLAARDILGACEEIDLLARSRCAAHAPARRASRARRISRSVAAQRRDLVAPDVMRGRVAGDAQALALDRAAPRPRCGRPRGGGSPSRIASTPASSATSSLPVDEPMNTLIPAAPGRRSSSARSATLSCVPPTQKAKSQCMRPVARADLVGERRLGGRRRVGVGHLEHGGDAAEHGRARSRLEVLLVDRPGLAEMHLAVDHAGQDVQPGAIDALAGGGARSDRRSRRCGRRARRRRADRSPSWLTTVPLRKNEIERLGHGLVLASRRLRATMNAA